MSIIEFVSKYLKFFIFITVRNTARNEKKFSSLLLQLARQWNANAQQ